MGKHIVWDWNGTLFDDVAAVYSASVEIFAARGLPAVTLAEYRAAYTRPIPAFYARLFGHDVDPTVFAGMDRDWHDAYRSRLTGCGLARQATDTLASWRERGGTQSLLSMWRHEELLPFVRRLGIAAEFVRIDGLRGPGGDRKANHLVRHLAALEIDAAAVLLVGDSVDDADAAAAVGAACVLYDGGYHDRATLDAVGVPVADTLSGALVHAEDRAGP